MSLYLFWWLHFCHSLHLVFSTWSLSLPPPLCLILHSPMPNLLLFWSPKPNLLIPLPIVLTFTIFYSPILGLSLFYSPILGPSLFYSPILGLSLFYSPILGLSTFCLLSLISLFCPTVFDLSLTHLPLCVQSLSLSLSLSLFCPAVWSLSLSCPTVSDLSLFCPLCLVSLSLSLFCPTVSGLSLSLLPHCIWSLSLSSAPLCLVSLSLSLLPTVSDLSLSCPTVSDLSLSLFCPTVSGLSLSLFCLTVSDLPLSSAPPCLISLSPLPLAFNFSLFCSSASCLTLFCISYELGLAHLLPASGLSQFCPPSLCLVSQSSTLLCLVSYCSASPPHVCSFHFSNPPSCATHVWSLTLLLLCILSHTSSAPVMSWVSLICYPLPHAWSLTLLCFHPLPCMLHPSSFYRLCLIFLTVCTIPPGLVSHSPLLHPWSLTLPLVLSS